MTETVAAIAQARLSSIDIALQSYQKIDLTDVENTDERYLLENETEFLFLSSFDWQFAP